MVNSFLRVLALALVFSSSNAGLVFSDKMASGQAAAQSCHSSYVGICIAPGNSDVDCAGGRGNGPRYAQGPFRVVGPDQYGLDRDRDGIGCE